MQSMNNAPPITMANAFLPQPICNWMVERATGMLQEARTYDPETGAPRQSHSRTNRAALFEILEADMILLLIRLKIATALRVPSRALENSQVLHYAEGQEFKPHYDFLDPKVPALADDIARNMSAVSARVAAVPGRNVIGIELPNQRREKVVLRDLISTSEYENTNAALVLALGKNIGGEPVIADLAKMPHLLIAGTTGSGKSVAINTMILSLLFRMPPSLCKLIMIDPKMLELSAYDGIPHLLSPVVTDPRKAVVALKWAVREMEERYRKMSKLGVRGVEAFNDRIRKAKEKGEQLKRSAWRRWRAPPASTSLPRRNAPPSTSSPARSRRTSRHASRSK